MLVRWNGQPAARQQAGAFGWLWRSGTGGGAAPASTDSPRFTRRRRFIGAALGFLFLVLT